MLARFAAGAAGMTKLVTTVIKVFFYSQACLLLCSIVVAMELRLFLVFQLNCNQLLGNF